MIHHRHRQSSLICILVLLGALQFARAASTSVTFEAESGVLGAEFTNGVSGGVQFISISTTNQNSSNPGSSNRVATYTVTFPQAGTYQLYARLRVGPGAANDDSLFFASSFGIKSPTNNADWNLINNISGNGFTASTAIVTGGGTAGSGVWKWLNLSALLGQNGFTVSAGNLTQTWQIGAREDGLDLDKFVFGPLNYSFTVSNLDNGTDGTPPPPPLCTVDWTNTQQRIDGFGFSSAWCGTLSAAKNAALYDTLGMSLLRIRIDPNQNWSSETANATAARQRGIKVLGSAWTPPAAMKSNTNGVGGSLLANQYTAYAAWLNQAATSIGLDYVSFQNEPDITVTYESCDWTPAQMLTFCRSNAPAIGKPVVMPESFNFNDAWSDPTLNDPVAVNNIAVVGGHFYGNGNRVHANAIAKGKPVWMTEHYLDGGTTNFPVCLNLAKEISDAMKNQFNAYIAWWVQDGDTNINLVKQSGAIMKDGYTMGQFSKFIRPGFHRVGATNTTGSAEITAYKDVASSNYVIVAINRGTTVVTQQFNLSGFPANSAVTPWLTSYAESLAVQAPITNVGTSFTYSIQPSNIVTFVGTVPPPTPANLAATPGLNAVNLSWSAVTGASSYNLKRATTSGGPYPTVTNVTTTSLSDSGVAFGTNYYYVVSAVNVSGESANSAEAVAQITQSFALLPVADSYAQDTTPTSNYGTLTNLWVKNASSAPVRRAYLLFDVRALTGVQSATVTLTASRVDAAATIYYEAVSTNWTETGINWNNQPGTGVALFTNVVSTTGVAAVFDVTGAVANAATNGGWLAIRIAAQANTANSLIEFCSRESTTPSLRPMLTYTLPANTPPILAAISNQMVGAGVTMIITNSATDSDVPTQTLTYSLLASPTNAVLNTNSGVLTWRPLVTQANTTNAFTVMVADNGTPSLSATQSFTATVGLLTPPQFSSVALAGSQLALQVSGDSGPDYQIQASTNLVNWSAIFTTNSPPLPFVWTNSNTALPMNFYRIQAGPPF